MSFKSISLFLNKKILWFWIEWKRVPIENFRNSGRTSYIPVCRARVERGLWRRRHHAHPLSDVEERPSSHAPSASGVRKHRLYYNSIILILKKSRTSPVMSCRIDVFELYLNDLEVVIKSGIYEFKVIHSRWNCIK